MKNVLVIKTSLQGENSQSNKLANLFVEQLSAKSEVSVVKRDLATDALPHLTGAEMGAWMTAAEARSPEQAQTAKLSDSLIEEVMHADHIVLALPLYNFDSPSTFKPWIDRIARAGITFKYSEQGPVGLITDKKVTAIFTRGGMYAGTPRDTQTPYIKNVLAFLGITDVDTVYAEGLAMGDEPAQQAIEAAKQKINELIG